MPTYRKVPLSAQLQVKLTQDLRSAIERAAANEGKSLSDWLRDLAIDAIERSARVRENPASA